MLSPTPPKAPPCDAFPRNLIVAIPNGGRATQLSLRPHLFHHQLTAAHRARQPVIAGSCRRPIRARLAPSLAQLAAAAPGPDPGQRHLLNPLPATPSAALAAPSPASACRIPSQTPTTLPPQPWPPRASEPVRSTRPAGPSAPSPSASSTPRAGIPRRSAAGGTTMTPTTAVTPRSPSRCLPSPPRASSRASRPWTSTTRSTPPRGGPR